MVLAITVDPILSKFVVLSSVIILIGLILRILKQPSIITYIIVGVIVGPFGIGLIDDEALITNLGSLGLVLLLFFIGMEIHLPDLISNWKVSIIGTSLQILISIVVIWLFSYFFGWKQNQVILLGFVISLSSTAVIIKLLQERNQLHSVVGKNVLGILLAQDVLIVPMLITLSYLGGHRPEKIELVKQLIGTLIITGILIYLIKKKEIKLPFEKLIESDHEMQVFIAFSLCFGISILTAVLGLSSALGAFVAGLIISSTKSTEWVHNSLNAFRIMFLALFFVSVGMLIDLQFLLDNSITIAALVTMVFVINNTINTLVLKSFGNTWKTSLYAGALLSQIGEFSFVIGSTGYYNGIIHEYAYQLTISTIAITLLLSPLWISFSAKILGFSGKLKTIKEKIIN